MTFSAVGQQQKHHVESCIRCNFTQPSGINLTDGSDPRIYCIIFFDMLIKNGFLYGFWLFHRLGYLHNTTVKGRQNEIPLNCNRPQMIYAYRYTTTTLHLQISHASTVARRRISQLSLEFRSCIQRSVTRG